MTVKTHRGQDRNERDKTCRFCEREAHYHSQNVDGERMLGDSVNHCQAHRAEGRAQAEVELPGWEKLGYTLEAWQALPGDDRWRLVEENSTNRLTRSRK